MWPKEYKDYPRDAPLVRERLEPGKGIIGCEMHDLNGWGEAHHRPKKRRKGLIAMILEKIFGDDR